MNLLEWLQNLKQHSTPIGAFCGKKFDHESQPFYRYGFPPVTQFFDSRTVQQGAPLNCNAPGKCLFLQIEMEKILENWRKGPSTSPKCNEKIKSA